MTETTPTEVQKPKRENALANIAFNILIPVIVLNQLSKRLGDDGPVIALGVALAFPLVYGLWDYLTRKHKNAISILGIVNVLITGGLALYQLEGIWFAIKEAAFPAILGVAVYVSAFTKNPFIRFVAYNPQVLQVETIQSHLKERGTEKEFAKHLGQSTKLLAVSFFISSLLNFLLARWVFKDIDQTLSELERTTILNEQIAEMTWLSFIVIVLPLMAFMGLVLWHLFSGIHKLTGLGMQDVLPEAHQSKTSS